MHATLAAFGYPNRLILETDHWALLLRPAQITLGSLVLINKSQATALSSLPHAAFSDLGSVCKALEHALSAAFGYDKINYQMLMMVDPHVHYHIFPRYGREVSFCGKPFTDRAWPGPPDLKQTLDMDDSLAEALAAEIRHHLP
jgi:diadenosine tetraphosphate (Ap4A) HIT family hydrolase